MSVRHADGQSFGDGPESDSEGLSVRWSGADGYPRWRFVTNHAHVLETIARDPTIRLRDVALIVGVTERTAAQIVDDFVKAGYLTKTREGRRNRYEIHGELPLRHPQHQHRTVGDLLRFLAAPREDEVSGSQPSLPESSDGRFGQ